MCRRPFLPLILIVVATGAWADGPSEDHARLARSAMCVGDRFPPNLRLGFLHDVGIEMLERSPLFADQCRRLAETPHVLVVVRLSLTLPCATHHARTTIKHHAAGAIVADVEMGVGVSYPRYLAHELEHVLEQLDGWDLAALANQPGSGVTLLESGTYETKRALAAGATVGREMAAWHEPEAPAEVLHSPPE
jgi:hypothetical protein